MAKTRGPLFVLALCAALGLGALAALLLEGGPRERTEPAADETPPAREPVPAVPAVEGAEAPAPEDAPVERERVADAAAAAPAQGTAREGELRGRVVDGRGTPLPGARVELARGVAPDYDVLDLGATRAPAALAHALADEAGAFRFPLALGEPVDVHAALEGYSDALATDAYAGQELELVLAAGALVYGTVTRASDGAPVEGARVRVFQLGGRSALTSETSTRADGGYELTSPVREDATLEVVPVDLQCSDWIALEIGPDDRCRRDVVLLDGLVVAGTVRDAATGTPIADAEVGEGWWYRRTARSDARGEFRLPGFGDPGVPELYARAHGYGEGKVDHFPAPVEGVMRVDFALTPARSARGRLVDEGGRPVADAYVAAVASEFGPGGQRTDWRAARSDAEGRFRIEDLARDLGHALLVTKAGFATLALDFPKEEFEAAELELGDIVLRAPALLAGRVVTPDGSGVAGVRVELVGWNADRFRLSQDEAHPRGQFYVDTRSATSDALGRFWFAGVAGGSYRISTHVEGRVEGAGEPLEVRPGARRDEIVLVLDTGGLIRGQVLGDAGEPLAGVFVSARVERLRDPAAAAQAGHVSQETEADGLFELSGLPEGEYSVHAYPLQTPVADASAPWLASEVEHVATGSQPITIALARGASIRGRLVDAHGAPLFGYVVAAAGGGTLSGEFSTTDAEGRFALTVTRASSWTVEVRGSPQGNDFQTVYLRKEGVPAGTQDLVLALEK